MKFENKTVLVTGANRGIGKSIVETLLTKGIKKVYAASRNVSAIPSFNDDRVESLELDITNKGQVEKASEIASDVDILINNAGVAAFISLLDGPMDQIERDMNTNYYGTLNMVRSFVPHLEKKKDSAIVNVVTIAAFVNFPTLGGYSASKAALFSLSQGIRIELNAKGIAVHTVNPGPIDTEMTKDYDAEKTSPELTSENMITALEAGEVDIFPDVVSQQMFGAWKEDYLALENMVLGMVSEG